MKKLTCFKAYDIRGKLGEELNEDIAWRIGRAYGEFLKPKTIVLGGDVRLTSETLKLALAKGFQDAGVDVLDIGMSGTEEIYFATFHLGVDGGIEVTASHNPMDYNGMKLVREGARPISGDTGLRDVQRLAEANDFPPVDETKRGRYQQINLRDAYVDHLFGYINVKNLTPLKLVINSGNGAAGPVVDAIEARFNALGAPVELIKVHNTPDGNFPNGIPNPLLPECRDDTRNAVIKHGADMGIAFDGDFDRCFLFDEKGQFIEGYYIVGLLAEAFLEKNPGAKIIHDPRLSWNTVDGFAAALNAFVAQNYGAGERERVRKGYQVSLWTVGIWGVLVSAVFICFPNAIADIFFHEPKAVATAVGYLVIIGFSEAFMCVELTTIGALSGLGRTRLCSVISIVLTSARIPLAIVLSGIMGLDGIWWALTSTSIVKGIIFTCTFFWIMREKNV